MPAVAFYKKKGVMRIYSVTTTGGEAYLQVRFQNGNVNFSMGPPFPEQQLVLDRNTFTSDASFIDIDDSSILTPQPLSFEVTGTDKYSLITLRALSDAFAEASTATGAWPVGNKSWVGFNEQSITRKNGDGVAVTIPEFAFDAIKLVRVELRMEKTSTEAAVDSLVFAFSGVNFPRDQVTGTLSAGSLNFTANGLMYGDVTFATAFGSGTDTEA
jgi:hypothetical protein